MRSKAFTLIETVLATILAGILVIGAAAVLQNMQNQTALFKTSVDTDMRWVEANRHLAEKIHSSSYLTVSAIGNTPSTLTLYDYSDTKRGVYTNDDVAGLSYQDSDTGAITTFPGISVTFSAPNLAPNPKEKGTKYAKLIETIINYSKPFTSTLRLRTAVAVKPPATWAKIIYGGDNYPAGSMYSIQSTSDGYFIISGEAFEPKREDYTGFGYGVGYTEDAECMPYLSKIDKNGNIIWERTYAIGSGADIMRKNYAIEAFKQSGQTVVSDGFALADVYFQTRHIPYNYVGTDPFLTNRGTILRVEANGDVRWLQQFGTQTGLHMFNTIRQTYDLTGFIAAGCAWTSYDDYVDDDNYATDGFLGMVNEDGSNKHMRYFGGENLYPNMITWCRNTPYPYICVMDEITPCVEYAFDNNGNASGYILVGATLNYDFANLPYNNYQGLPDSAVYIVGVDANGKYLWSRAYGRDGWYYVPRSCAIVKTSSGAYDGYIIAGCIPSYTDTFNSLFGSIPSSNFGDFPGDPPEMKGFLLRLDKDFNVQWIKTYGVSGKSDFREIKQTIDGGFIVAGYTKPTGIGDYNYDCWLVKTDSYGNETWSQTYGGAEDDEAFTVQEVVGGSNNTEGYIVGGYTGSFIIGSEWQNIYLFRTDVDGNCLPASDPVYISQHSHPIPATVTSIVYNDDSSSSSSSINDRHNTATDCQCVTMPSS